MTEEGNPTRRSVLQKGAAFGVTSLGLAVTGNVGATSHSATADNARNFGRVYANDVLWRTNVIRKNDEQFDPDDDLFFIHGGDPDNGGDGKLQPAVSESAPGDQDYNGGKWTHFGTKVIDRSRYEDEYKPITSESELRNAEEEGVVEITKGRPYDSAPPNYFLCPLNGRA